MKRTWAVILSAALLASCRTSQPTTNPFLRTTVPPPATSPGLVVTPGTPYAQGISPPLVTTPAPVVTQPVPVTPVPVAPITAPPIMPQGDKFNPPGGSYLFHQSSHETPAARTQSVSTPLAVSAKPGRIVVQACYAPPEDRPETVMSPDGFIENPFVVKRRKIENPQAVSRDGYIENPYVKPKGKVPAPPPVARSNPTTKTLPRDQVPLVRTQPLKKPAPSPTTTPVVRAKSSAERAQPAARLTFGEPPNKLPQLPDRMSVSSAGQGNLLRIVGESLPGSAGSTVVSAQAPAPVAMPAFRAAQSPAVAAGDGTVLRITAGALRSTVRSSNDLSPPPVAVVAPQTGSESTATFVTPDATQPVVQAAFPPVPSRQTKRYAHSVDYRTLRGRLEYSPDQREWKLRYLPSDGQTDSFGGSVLLTASSALKPFQPGDFVVVEGSLADDTTTPAGDAPRYTATRIDRLAR